MAGKRATIPISLDADATQGAKTHKSATQLSYSGILDRFTKDVAFALRSTERGLTRSAMLIQDVLATVVFPNPGRNTEQRTMGVGSQGSMTYTAQAPPQRSLPNFSTSVMILLHRSRPDSFPAQPTARLPSPGLAPRTPSWNSLPLSGSRTRLAAWLRSANPL